LHCDLDGVRSGGGGRSDGWRPQKNGARTGYAHLVDAFVLSKEVPREGERLGVISVTPTFNGRSGGLALLGRF
jgi:hypothetical protein